MTVLVSSGGATENSAASWGRDCPPEEAEEEGSIGFAVELFVGGLEGHCKVVAVGRVAIGLCRLLFVALWRCYTIIVVLLRSWSCKLMRWSCRKTFDRLKLASEEMRNRSDPEPPPPPLFFDLL